MTRFQTAMLCKKPINTVVRLVRKADNETLDFAVLPGSSWSWQQAREHPEVHQMVKAEGADCLASRCYLAVLTGSEAIRLEDFGLSA